MKTCGGIMWMCRVLRSYSCITSWSLFCHVESITSCVSIMSHLVWERSNLYCTIQLVRWLLYCVCGDCCTMGEYWDSIGKCQRTHIYEHVPKKSITILAVLSSLHVDGSYIEEGQLVRLTLHQILYTQLIIIPASVDTYELVQEYQYLREAKKYKT